MHTGVGVPISAFAGFALGGLFVVGSRSLLVALMAAGGASVVAFQAWVLSRKVGSPGGAGVFILLCLLAGAVFYPVSWRSVCGAHSIKVGTELRALVQTVRNNLTDSGQLPGSFALFAAEHDLDGVWTSGSCRCDDLEMVRVGRWTLADYRRGRITLDELRREATAHPPGEVETHGSVTLWRDRSAWQQHLIVAVRVAPGTEWDYYDLIAWGDCTVRAIDREEVLTSIERAAAAGTPYPQELIDLLNRPVPRR